MHYYAFLCKIMRNYAFYVKLCEIMLNYILCEIIHLYANLFIFMQNYAKLCEINIFM